MELGYLRNVTGSGLVEPTLEKMPVSQLLKDFTTFYGT
jgi:hypothetical protein